MTHRVCENASPGRKMTEHHVPKSSEDIHTPVSLEVFGNATKQWLALGYLGVGWAGPHLYFLVDLLKHPGDDVLALHGLDLLSRWPDVLQKYLLSLCIYPCVCVKHLFMRKTSSNTLFSLLHGHTLISEVLLLHEVHAHRPAENNKSLFPGEIQG